MRELFVLQIVIPIFSRWHRSRKLPMSREKILDFLCEDVSARVIIGCDDYVGFPVSRMFKYLA